MLLWDNESHLQAQCPGVGRAHLPGILVGSRERARRGQAWEEVRMQARSAAAAVPVDTLVATEGGASEPTSNKTIICAIHSQLPPPPPPPPQSFHQCRRVMYMQCERCVYAFIGSTARTPHTHTHTHTHTTHICTRLMGGINRCIYT